MQPARTERTKLEQTIVLEADNLFPWRTRFRLLRRAAPMRVQSYYLAVALQEPLYVSRAYGFSGEDVRRSLALE